MLLIISDDGPGMRVDVRERVFEPFFSTKAQATGLGLSTVYGIVNQNGAEIDLMTEPGKGTEIRIMWPASSEEIEGTSGDGGYEKKGGAETILVAEDDPAVRELTRNVLASHGYRVLDAGNGHRALELCFENLDSLELLITDVIMPGIGGKELADTMAEQIPGLPVLFMSGYAEDHIAHNGTVQAGIEFLKKPFTVQQLLDKVRLVLDRI
jgi:CheY-like chemotaxis protein